MTDIPANSDGIESLKVPGQEPLQHGMRIVRALRVVDDFLIAGESEEKIRSHLRAEYGFHIEIETAIIETAKERAREK